MAKRCPSASITATRVATPTWFAARPTPFAAAIVSNMSSMNLRIVVVHDVHLGAPLAKHRRAEQVQRQQAHTGAEVPGRTRCRPG